MNPDPGGPKTYGSRFGSGSATLLYLRIFFVSYCGKWMYEINMDLYQYGLSRDESVCVYTNAAFLAAADSKRFVLFNVRNGKFVGILQIPTHLERNKGTQDLYLNSDH